MENVLPGNSEEWGKNMVGKNMIEIFEQLPGFLSYCASTVAATRNPKFAFLRLGVSM